MFVGGRNVQHRILFIYYQPHVKVKLVHNDQDEPGRRSLMRLSALRPESLVSR